MESEVAMLAGLFAAAVLLAIVSASGYAAILLT